MTYINKKVFLILFLLNSCAHLEYREIYDLAKNSIVGIEDLKIDSEFLENRQSSFIKIKLGRTRIAIFSLSSYSGDIFTWVGANNEKIITKNGRIIATNELDYNLEILTKSQIGLSSNENSQYEVLIALSEPSATISQLITVNKLENQTLSREQNYLAEKYLEEFKTKTYKWSGTNYYWIDQKSRLPLKTIATPHPLLGQIEIDYFYKYKKQ